MARPGTHVVSVRQAVRPAPFRGTVLKGLAGRAAAVLSPAGADVRILVVGDRAMLRVNDRFLGRRRTTNVISFADDDAPRGGVLSGDVVISAPTCLRETSGWPGSPEERAFFFVLHGMLHLLGHDHEKGPAAARRMRRLELKVYDAVLSRRQGRPR